jgi:hypothetical protein
MKLATLIKISNNADLVFSYAAIVPEKKIN